MSANIKLGNNTITGVNSIKVKNADDETQYVTFSLGGSAVLDHTATFVVEEETYAIYSVLEGVKMTSPQTPSKSGYAFDGWLNSAQEKVSFPYSMSETEATFTASFVQAYAMQITGLGNNSPTSQSYTASGATFPTSFDEVTVDGNVFIKIPTMYRKVTASSSGQITGFIISNTKQDDDFLPYPCFVSPDGTILPYILIGKYMISSSTEANSVDATKVSLTPAQGLALCKSKGTGYYAYDIWTQKLFQDLELAIGKKVNYQDGSAAITTSKIGLAHLDQGHWVQGVIGSGGTWYVCYDPDNYEALSATDSPIPSTYVALSYSQPTTSGVEIQSLGYDTSNPFANLPSAVTTNTSYNTYYCDGYYYSSGNRPVFSFVGSATAVNGLWGCDADVGWSSTLGVRLCYRPL